MPTYKRGSGEDAETVLTVAGSASDRACAAEGSGYELQEETAAKPARAPRRSARAAEGDQPEGSSG